MSLTASPLMATIDFRSWRIESDAECWALGKPRTRLSKDKQREIYLENPSYHASLEQALRALLERELRGSDTRGAKQILEFLRQMKQDIFEAMGVAL